MSLSSGSQPPVARKRRWCLIALPLTGVVAIGLGAAGFSRLSNDISPSWNGEGLRIEVVQPPAPRVEAGPRMEVGELVDGYRHVPASAPSEHFETEDLFAWLEPLPPLPEPARFEPEPRRPLPVPVALPAPPPMSGDGDPYGFDAPRPDYAAARQARRERLERLERLERMRSWEREARETAADWRRVATAGEPRWLPVGESSRDTVFY